MAIIKDGRAGGTVQMGVDAVYRGMVGLFDPSGAAIAAGNPLPVAIATSLAAGTNIIGAVNQAGSWTVSVSSLPPIPTGSNTIGAVNQAGSWAVTLGAALPVGGNAIGAVAQGAAGATAWKVDGSGVTQPLSGTVNLGTLGGAATAALQSNAITALNTIATNTTPDNTAVQSGVWAVRTQDGVGNALASATTTPVGNEQALVVRPIASGVQQVAPTDGAKATYSAAIVGLVASATTPTDVFAITGSASKTVRVTRLAISATQATAAVRDIVLLKRSTANVGGTSTAPTAVPHDSASAAATATLAAYTANPTTLGTLVGNLRAHKVYVGTTTGVGACDDIIWDFGVRPSQAPVLRGTSQVLAVNLAGVVSATSSFDINIEWTEE